MTSTASVVIDHVAATGASLPNKFLYPEFAGFAGEDLLHDIVSAILPLSLLRTWEIFERKHAYDNDCFLSLGTVAKKARRTQRTVNRNIATFMARDLLVLRSEYKFFRRSDDNSTYKKAVVVKDFSGLYALAHEYYEWQYSSAYLSPEYEYVEHIQHDPCLVAKLCRFEDYRRLLEHHRDPFAQVQEDRRFTEYRADAPLQGDTKQAEEAKNHVSSLNKTKLLRKEQPNALAEVSKERINEKAYEKSLYRDSFDSDGPLEVGEEASATLHSGCKPVVQDYTKRVRKNKTGTTIPNESQTNPVPVPQKDVPPGAGKTRESAETHQDVRQAMATPGGVEPSRKAAPPVNLLVRSFVHEIAGIFGDLNEKGSKTGIERSIETFALEQPSDMLLCLMRAFVIARNTPTEKIRYHHPETGVPNRMPLFCAMFKTFARALASGSMWEYTWECMIEDIAADDRLNLWLCEHQADLAGPFGIPSAIALPVTLEEAVETPTEKAETSDVREEPSVSAGAEEGWKQREDAYDWARYVLGELINNEYGNLTVDISLPKQGTRYTILLLDGAGEGYRLVCESDVDQVVAMARNRTFSTVPEVSINQAEAEAEVSPR